MNNLKIYKWIYRAKLYYIDWSIDGDSYNEGMCSSFYSTNQLSSFLITDEIPEFNYEFLKGTEQPTDSEPFYWWPVTEIAPRLNAFNILLSIYWEKLSFIQKLNTVLYKIYYSFKFK